MTDAEHADTGYSGFLGSVRSTVDALKTGHEPPQLEAGEGGVSERRQSTHVITVLLGEVLEQIHGIAERLEAVEQVTTADVMPLLRDRTAELETTLQRAAEVGPQLEAVRSEVAGQITVVREDLAARMDALTQRITSVEQASSGGNEQLLAQVRAALDEDIRNPLLKRTGGMARQIMLIAETLDPSGEGLAAQLAEQDAQRQEQLAGVQAELARVAAEADTRQAALAAPIAALTEPIAAVQAELGRLASESDARTAALAAPIAALQAQVAGVVEEARTSQAALQTEVARMLEEARTGQAGLTEHLTAPLEQLRTDLAELRSQASDRDGRVSALQTSLDAVAQQLPALAAAVAGSTAETAGSVQELRTWLSDSVVSELRELVQAGTAAMQRQTKALAEATSGALNSLQTGLAQAIASEGASQRSAISEAGAAQDAVAQRVLTALEASTRAAEETAGQIADQVRRAVESQGSLSAVVEELRTASLEVGSSLRDVSGAVKSSRSQLEDVAMAQAHAAEAQQRVLNGQSELRTALDLQQVRAVRPADLQQLVAEVSAVGAELARQGYSWQRLGDQLASFTTRVEALESGRPAPPPERPDGPPAPAS